MAITLKRQLSNDEKLVILPRRGRKCFANRLIFWKRSISDNELEIKQWFKAHGHTMGFPLSAAE